MLALETKLIKKTEQYKDILFFIIISILGVLIRLPGKDYISKDMYVFLIPWYRTIKEQGGFSALSSQIGDYNILYQTLICLFSYLNTNCVYLYKFLSCIFDFFLALSSSLFICKLMGQCRLNVMFNGIYFCLLFSPTIVFNSSYWGQCDAIYSTFVILTLYLLFRQSYPMAFLFLGIAFAFKLQTIFIIPFIIYLYFYRKNFSLLYFGITLATFELSGLPGFLHGRSLTAPFDIYLYQTTEQPVLYANIPNFWCIIGDNYEYLSSFSIILTLCLLGFGLYMVLSHQKELHSPGEFLSVCCWVIWTCIMFLPVMHERYTFLLDILLILLCFTKKSYISFAIISNLISVITYSYFLFDTPYNTAGTSVIFFACYLLFSFYVFFNNLLCRDAHTLTK